MRRVIGNISDWTIIQRNSGSKADILVNGVMPKEAYNAPRDEIFVRLAYECNGAPVEERFDRISVKVDSVGCWECLLKDVPAGGMYRFETDISDRDRFHTVHNLGVGDIWAIAGQSNAAGFSKGMIDDPPEIGVAMFTADQQWQMATHPLGNGGGHSPFLHFAKILRQRLQIPIGLIPLAVGGSALRDWNSAEGDAPLYQRMRKTIGILKNNVKGLIWYQGCHEAGLNDSPGTYCDRFCDFARTLRSDLGKPELPVILAQLNKSSWTCSSGTDRDWSIAREQQRLIPKRLDYTAVVPTLDLSLADGIHTSVEGNMVLGRRFAEAAMGMVYGHSVEWMAPEIASARLHADGMNLLVTFGHDRGGLLAISDNPKDFSAEDADGAIPVRRVEIRGTDSVMIEFARKAGQNPVLHGLCGMNPSFSIRRATDMMPMLAFYNYKIQSSQ